MSSILTRLSAMRTRHAVVLIVGVGVIVYALAGLVAGPSIQGDTASYLTLAHLIGRGSLHGWDGLRTPGFPILIWVADYHLSLIVVLQAAAIVAAAVLVYLSALSVCRARWIPLVGAVAFLCIPAVIDSSLTILTEGLSIFLVAVATYVLSRIEGDRSSGWSSLWWWLALSVDLALLALTRPNLAVLAFVVVLAYLIRWLRRSAGEASSGVRPYPSVALGSLMVIVMVGGSLLGWSAVDAANTGFFGPSTLQGLSLANATCPLTTTALPEYHHVIVDSGFLAAERKYEAAGQGCVGAVFLAHLPRTSTAELSRELSAMATSIITTHSGAYLGYAAGHVADELVNASAYPHRSKSVAFHLPETVLWLGLLAGSAVLVIARIRRRPIGAPFFLVVLTSASILSALANALVDAPYTRQMVPLLPIAVAFDLMLIDLIVAGRFRARGDREGATPLVGTAAKR